MCRTNSQISDNIYTLGGCIFHPGICSHLRFFSAVIVRYLSFCMCVISSVGKFTYPCHHDRIPLSPNGRNAPLAKRGFYFCTVSLNRKELHPPLVRYCCVVSMSPSLRRSCNARRTVDWDSLRSLAMVGIAGQHSFFIFTMLARYRYTAIARWDSFP